MNNHKEQDLVKRFLKENKKEIKDNGFSQRVMQHLPDRYEHITIALHIIGAGLAIVLFFILGGPADTLNLLNHIHNFSLMEWITAHLPFVLSTAFTCLVLLAHQLYSLEE